VGGGEHGKKGGGKLAGERGGREPKCPEELSTKKKDSNWKKQKTRKQRGETNKPNKGGNEKDGGKLLGRKNCRPKTEGRVVGWGKRQDGQKVRLNAKLGGNLQRVENRKRNEAAG